MKFRLTYQRKAYRKHFKVTPWAIRELLQWVNSHYNSPKIYITENGYSDANMEDDDKISYLQVKKKQIRKEHVIELCVHFFLELHEQC